MKSIRLGSCAFSLVLVAAAWAIGQTTIPAATPTTAPTTRVSWHLNPKLPTIFIVGDSTAQNGDPGHTGWGKPFASYVDMTKANYVNAAVGGRSSRTYVAEGRWDRVAAAVKEGDFVLVGFGHNDGGGVSFRGSLPGIGDETQDVENKTTHAHETVHTYGWYMRKMVEETKAKDAIPIVVAVTPRNIWNDGRVEREMGKFNEWAKQVAIAERVAFIDLTDMVCDRYEQMGPDEVKKLFPIDHTHTGPQGAAINAEYVLAGVKALHRQMLLQLLSAAAMDVAPATQPSVVLGRATRGAAGTFDESYFLNVQEPADPKLPDVILIGDSTVRNGRGDGADGQWGWGDALRAWIDPHKVNLVNRALGGTTAGSFQKGEWPGVLEIIKPGDVVFIQFGTNSDGPPLGIGEETAQKRNRDGSTATAHTYGWYLRKYIADIRSKDATPVLCTLVPRNVWKNGAYAAHDVHADWARQVASDEKVDLLDLYAAGSKRYAAMGEKGATAVFADGRVHTNHEGAEILAAVVVEELKQLPDNPTADYLHDKPEPSW
jgi:lysophospholipase L1-like esterase